MTVETKLATIDGALDDIKTAIIAKGVTPSEDITTYASAISSIPTEQELGIPREVSPQGVYGMPTTSFTFSLPSDATSLENYALYFNGCTGLTSVDLSSLTTISNSVFVDVFNGCIGLTSVDLSGLITISGGQQLMETAFKGCTSLTSINLSSLTTINSDFCTRGMCNGCTSLTSVDLSSLTNLSNQYCFSAVFVNCTSLTTLSFSALTSTSFGNYTNQFSYMLSGVTGCTVHFPSNLQSVIGSWSDVTNGFGGTNTTVLFDLPATT